jgi:hypothetical protein
VDARPLAESWRQEPGTPIYGTTYRPHSDPAGILADEPTVRAALARACRYTADRLIVPRDLNTSPKA